MKRVLMLAAAGLFVVGCASPNVNPPQARVNTGYVDFYADSSEELNWQVRRFWSVDQAGVCAKLLMTPL